MIRYCIRRQTGLSINDSVEGELLETKIERVVSTNEPIKDGAPIIYGERKDGVQASHNIRTDRFEVAIDAMDKTAKSYKARRENKAEPKAEMKAEKGGGDKGKGDAGSESIQGEKG